VPDTYELTLSRQPMRAGKMTFLGPTGGFAMSKPTGDKRTVSLGEIEITERRTTTLTVDISQAFGEEQRYRMSAVSDELACATTQEFGHSASGLASASAAAGERIALTSPSIRRLTCGLPS